MLHQEITKKILKMVSLNENIVRKNQIEIIELKNTITMIFKKNKNNWTC